jgi:hypothetical protein
MIQRPKNNQKNEDSGFPHPKKFKTQKSPFKLLATVFWDRDRNLFVDYLEKDATITAKYYVLLADKAKQELVSKHRGKLLKLILFFKMMLLFRRWLIMQQKFADLRFEGQKQPTYSPNVGPSEYYLFPNLKKHLKERKFLSIEDASFAVDGWFVAQTKEFFLDGCRS